MQKLSLFNDPGTEKRLLMKEIVKYKDVSKNQREVWGSIRLTRKLNLVLKILLIRPTKDPADPHWLVVVVVPS